MPLRPRLLLLVLPSLLVGCVTPGQAQVPPPISVPLPPLARTTLAPVATIAAPAVKESSGLVRSRVDPGRFWTLNDSGNSPTIFALDREGTLLQTVTVTGAVNRDWEDIAVDGQGNLLIADTGNNANLRRDLCFYLVREPDPDAPAVSTAQASRKISLFYPEQTHFSPLRWNFDAEAVFCTYGRIYLLTKDRSDPYTTLYRLDDTGTDDPQPLTRVATFDIGGMVTAADATPDGRTIVVLTYTAIWLFRLRPEQPTGSDDWFHGSIRWLPIFAGQCEGICFDGDTLLISNEQRKLFRVPLSRLVTVR